ncbi:hypothetical protein SH2C18_12460 [Clostridium sediminicola]|uniref:sensor domain-containing protein n=1 Tax=Clostridium sediminicola TaxID=3114879 RepID=UPI0031F23B1C
MNKTKAKFSKNRISFKIVFLYFIFGILWISLSDHLLNLLVNDINTVNIIQTFKGILFIIITSMLLYLITINVVNSLVESHNTLILSEEFYSSLFNNNHLPFLIIDPDTKNIVKANKAALDFYKYSHEEIIQLKISQINILDDNSLINKINLEVNERTQRFEFKHKLSTGEIKDVEVFNGPINIGNKVYLYSLIIDVTEKNLSKRKLLESNEKFTLFANHLEAGLFIKNLDGKYIFANKFLESFLGEKNLTNKYFSTYMSKIETLETIKYDKKVLNEGKISYEQIYTDATGNKVNFKCLKFPIIRENKKPLIGGFLFDITDYKIAENKIKDLAFTDIFTGLKNINYIKDRFDDSIKNNIKRMPILFIKINKIKEPSEILGYEFERKLIIKISERINNELFNNDALIFLNKYEFVVFTTQIEKDNIIKNLAQQILFVLSQPFIIDNYEISITSNTGISVYPDHGENLNHLIQKARIAITNKDYSMNDCINFYTNKLQSVVNKNFELENELNKAINNNELALAYQPIIDIHKKQLIKAEALLRWKNKIFGQVPPSTFIPIAEKSNFILKIGEWVLRQACLQIKSWVDAGESPLIISINISSLQLEQKDFTEMVESIILETDINPRYLEFEITESIAISDTENTLKILKIITDMGISVSMDDFGTGYSSLAKLKQLPVNTLKIDRSFINDLNKNNDSNSLVNAILAMAKSLNLHVIAEGVETLSQLEYLTNNNCDMVQGYFISKPVYIKDFNNFMKKPLEIYDESK